MLPLLPLSRYPVACFSVTPLQSYCAQCAHCAQIAKSSVLQRIPWVHFTQNRGISIVPTVPNFGSVTAPENLRPPLSQAELSRQPLNLQARHSGPGTAPGVYLSGGNNRPFLGTQRRFSRCFLSALLALSPTHTGRIFSLILGTARPQLRHCSGPSASRWGRIATAGT